MLDTGAAFAMVATVVLIWFAVKKYFVGLSAGLFWHLDSI